jgi:hypothetical protein
MALVRIVVSEELSASFMRVTRTGELGTTLAVTSNRRTLRQRTSEIRLVGIISNTPIMINMYKIVVLESERRQLLVDQSAYARKFHVTFIFL